ncbi:MAG: hypothetical protein AAB038_05375 [Planctomycetota bacterium]
MLNHDFISKSDPGKAVLLKNLALKLPGYAAVLGLTPAEVASVQADAAMFKHILDRQESYKTFNQGNTAYKNTLRDGPLGAPLGPLPVFPTLPVAPIVVSAGIFPRIRKLIGRIKATPTYNEGMGEDLGIVGDEQVIDVLNLKPVLKSRLDAGRPMIIWFKGSADSIEIYVDRKDGAGFVFLAIDTYPDYIDKFPMPEGLEAVVWDYKAVYRISDKHVGQFSDVISVTVTRQPR